MFHEQTIRLRKILELERENKTLKEENFNYRQELHEANNRIKALKTANRCLDKINNEYKECLLDLGTSAEHIMEVLDGVFEKEDNDSFDDSLWDMFKALEEDYD